MYVCPQSLAQSLNSRVIWFASLHQSRCRIEVYYLIIAARVKKCEISVLWQLIVGNSTTVILFCLLEIIFTFFYVPFLEREDHPSIIEASCSYFEAFTSIFLQDFSWQIAWKVSNKLCRILCQVLFVATVKIWIGNIVDGTFEVNFQGETKASSF